MKKYIVKITKNVKNGIAPVTVTLKNGLASEGMIFTENMLLCPEQQLKNLLSESPCRIELYKDNKPEKVKSKGGKK